MIRSRKTTKNCNICGREVAFLQLLRFETVCDYVTYRKDNRSFVSLTEREDVHICNYCWDKLEHEVSLRLGRK